ncbi:hypothetical protein [Actinomyces sp.]
MFLVGVLLLAAPVLFVAFLALAVDVTAANNRERKAADEVSQAKLADGSADNAGELIREKQRRDSSVVRICVILGFVLTGSMLYLPPLAWLASFFDADGNPPAVAMNLAFLSALLFVAPFGMLAFLCALLVRFFEKGKERD